MRRVATLFAGTVAAAVLVALAAGVAVIGSPAQSREMRLDAQKLADLRRISSAVDAHLKRTGSLPIDLNALKTADQSAPFRLTAPESGEPYAFSSIGPRSYRLCATFSHPTGVDDNSRDWNRTPEFWRHGPGRHCFTIDVPEPQPK